jgi:hypothetical protein
MMADVRSFSRFDARRGDYLLLTRDHPCIEQQEIDRPTSPDELGEGGLNAGQPRRGFCTSLSICRRSCEKGRNAGRLEQRL